MHEQKIAVVAMDGVFPGAATVDDLWCALQAGVEAGTSFSVDELVAAGVSRALAQRLDYVRRRPLLDRCDAFDAAFFGFNAVEAEALDPQLRLLMQCAYHALEEAGHVDAASRLRTGSFMGVRQSRYLDEHLLTSQRHLQSLGDGYLRMINRKDSAATLMSYKLDLGGPAISVNTACSTSLLAVHLACASLLSFECDVALAGGAAVPAFGPEGHLYVPGGFLSQDGRCRPFSDDAGGTIDGAGVAVVALKRYEDALRDRNVIHAVILSSAVNNDGADKAGYTAPSVRGQTRVISEALALADVSPESIGYVEAHGTGTRLGDPIEIRALTQAYRGHSEQTGWCQLGSIKANVGHLGAAAGVVGLIKAALVVRDGRIPVLVNFARANPELHLESSPFCVPKETINWPAQRTPRRAAVSSFGIGGTNVHAILEAPPAVPMRATRAAMAPRPALCVLSASSSAALGETARAVAGRLASAPASDLDDLAATLASSRAHLPWRMFTVVSDRAQLVTRWGGTDSPGQRLSGRPSVAFLFPGQGAQHRSMTLGLRARWPVFAQALDDVAQLVQRHGGFDLMALLNDPDETRLTQTAFAQPALFATSHALCVAWRSLGVEPAALLGHSVGELVAACVAGVFDLEDAVRLVCARGRFMQAAAPGRMLAVLLDPDTLVARLPAGVEIAVINGRRHCVVAGPEAALESLRAELDAEGIGARPVRTSHAFHSDSMTAAAQEIAAVARALPRAAPTLPLISNVTGELLNAVDAQSPDYWARQLRAPVQFQRGLHTLATLGIDVLLEVGAGTTLTSLARTELPAHCALASLPPATREAPEASSAERAFLQAAGELWSRGVPVDLDALAPKDPAFQRVPLPGYAFESTPHWVEAGGATGPRVGMHTGPSRVLLVPRSVSVPAAAMNTPAQAAVPTVAVQGTSPALEAAIRAGRLRLAVVDEGGAVTVVSSRTPLDTAALQLSVSGSRSSLCVVADFDRPGHVDLLLDLLAEPLSTGVVALLEGRVLSLVAQPLPATTDATVAAMALQQLLGVPDAWHDSLRTGWPWVQGARPLNLLRLTGPALQTPAAFPPGEAGQALAGAWLLVDEADVPLPEREERLARARAALRERGVRTVAWLACPGTSGTDGLRTLTRALSCLVHPDEAFYLDEACLAGPALHDLHGPTGSTPMTTSTNEPTTTAGGTGDVGGTILTIWSQVLGIEHLQRDDNFFDLGGNSLWALQIVSRVNEAFGCEIHLSELLNAATVNDLAALVEKRLFAGVDESELDALLGELGELSEEDLQRVLAQAN